MIRLTLITAAALAAAPLAAAPTTKAAEFLPQAAASDLFERTSSQIVLKDAKSPKVRDFANMMITDHTKSTAEVKAAAGAYGIKPGAPKLNAEQTKLIAALKAASAANRENVYLAQQVTAHQKTLAVMQAYAQGGDKEHLKGVAGKIVPTVETHLNEVKTLAAM